MKECNLLINEKNIKKIELLDLGMWVCLALNFGNIKNFTVYGFDNDKNKINHIKKGKSYISHINSSKIKEFIVKNKVTTTLNI